MSVQELSDTLVKGVWSREHILPKSKILMLTVGKVQIDITGGSEEFPSFRELCAEKCYWFMGI
jgi:hypothetical protein